MVRINPCTIAFRTLGCKLNQAETEALVRDARLAGYEVAPETEAGILVLNTCTVTHVADAKARQILHHWRRVNPAARIVVTGCYAERAPLELKDSGCADLVVSNPQKPSLFSLLPARPGAAAVPTPSEHVRAMVKIQDGCQNRCSYCVVPAVRPVETSVPLSQVLGEVQARAAEGCHEVVLTGTKIGSYQWQGTTLAGLVRRILSETHLERLRLSSLQPQDVSDELLDCITMPRVCPHFHVPLQSGSDTILRAMRRRYSTGQYRMAIDRMRGRVSDVAITTDVIVGFPGETAADFAATKRLCEDTGFAALHIFPYSPRPGTDAASLGPPVTTTERTTRTRALLQLARAAAASYRARFLGRTARVLWEAETRPGSGIYSGLTENYLRVHARSGRDLTNRITLAQIAGQGGSALRAEVLW